MNALLEDITHLGCFSLLLENLDTKDLCLLRRCSITLYRKCQEEISRRKDIWIRGTSKSWCYLSDIFADDHPFESVRPRLTRGPLADMESETEFFDTIASWCGGWGPLLYARETGPRIQPRLKNKGRSIQFSTPGVPFHSSCSSSSEDDSDSSTSTRTSSDERNPCLPVLIFDILCDGTWKWSAIHPIRDNDHENMTTDIDGEPTDLDVIYLKSTKTLGEDWDAATFLSGDLHLGGQEQRPPKYLITTHSDDDRVWTIRCSIVSPYCSETLVIEGEIRVAESRKDSTTEWASNSGFRGSQRLPRTNDTLQEDGRTFQPHPLLLRSVHELSVEEEVYGILDTYKIKPYQVWMTFHYFWDRRLQEEEDEENGKEKFHILLHEFNCESDLVHNMIANAPFPSSSKSRGSPVAFSGMGNQE